MNVLVDTHIVLWLASKPGELAAESLAVLTDPQAALWVSAASAWEIAIKTRIGRLNGEALLATWPDVLAAMHIVDLPIESGDAILAGRLNWPHKDPFDRVIVAQALRRGFTVATRDEQILDAALTPVLRA